ncbi:MAG: hypothetical protein J6Z23_08290 [Lachnospiraceae bacterium]|nr:hypothetical protein [Lachnospiraceae bacterium]MBP5255361.1 hypothetical protein [Lachnospiraceae bacterium]
MQKNAPDLREEAEQFGHVGEISHMTVSRRDTILNDIRSSTVQGIVSLTLSFAALACLLVGIYLSYRQEGQAGIRLAGLMVAALVLAVASVITGVYGLKNRQKIRHYMERRGIVISAVVIAALAGIYIIGLL